MNSTKSRCRVLSVGPRECTSSSSNCGVLVTRSLAGSRSRLKARRRRTVGPRPQACKDALRWPFTDVGTKIGHYKNASLWARCCFNHFWNLETILLLISLLLLPRTNAGGKKTSLPRRSKNGNDNDNGTCRAASSYPSVIAATAPWLESARIVLVWHLFALAAKRAKASRSPSPGHPAAPSLGN